MRFKYWVILYFMPFSALEGQNMTYKYFQLVEEADLLYKRSDYHGAARLLSDVIALNENNCRNNDIYNCACYSAISGDKINAFEKLFRLAARRSYSDLDQIKSDYDLNSLHASPRWDSLITTITKNKIRLEARLNKKLVKDLDTIYTIDQESRSRLEETVNRFGYSSKEAYDQRRLVQLGDSTNLLRVKIILDKYGWPDPDIVGSRGSKTIFLVIQHADLQTQIKYLPLLKSAVTSGHTAPANLALLEDRIAVRQCRKQVYGSQIIFDEKNKHGYVLPLTDPENVDSARLSVGLEPIKMYLTKMDIRWDIDKYKLDLPKIEAKAKELYCPGN